MVRTVVAANIIITESANLVRPDQECPAKQRAARLGSARSGSSRRCLFEPSRRIQLGHVRPCGLAFLATSEKESTRKGCCRGNQRHNLARSVARKATNGRQSLQSLEDTSLRERDSLEAVGADHKHVSAYAFCCRLHPLRWKATHCTLLSKSMAGT